MSLQTYLLHWTASFLTGPPCPTLTTGADANLARQEWRHPKPKLLYLFWEKWRQVQPNEFGRMPGPVAALELAAAHVYK